MKDPIKTIEAVKPTIAVRECPLITVKAINQKILEQLYPTRGELIDAPYDDLGPEWVAVGNVAGGDGILCRNMSNGEVRLCWDLRYCRTKQNIEDWAVFLAFRKHLRDSLQTIYVA